MNMESDAQARGSTGRNAAHQVYFRSIDTSDASDVRRWAEAMCLNETLDGLAAAFGVPANIGAVVDAVSQDWPDEARTIVRRVFSERLIGTSPR